MPLKKSNIVDVAAYKIMSAKHDITQVNKVLYETVGKYIFKLELFLEEVKNYANDKDDEDLKFILKKIEALRKEDQIKWKKISLDG